jgi:hypothetical protein
MNQPSSTVPARRAAERQSSCLAALVVLNQTQVVCGEIATIVFKWLLFVKGRSFNHIFCAVSHRGMMNNQASLELVVCKSDFSCAPIFKSMFYREIHHDQKNYFSIAGDGIFGWHRFVGDRLQYR